MTTEDLIRLALSTGVPLVVRDIQDRGGPQPSDWNRVRAFSDDIGAYGDLLIYASDQREQASALVGRLISTLAVLSFVPGGVTFAGLHFETTPEEDL